MNDAREEASRVSEVDGAGSHSEIHQGLRGRPCRVSQVDPNIHIRDIEQPVINITRPRGREKTGPEIFDLGVKIVPIHKFNSYDNLGGQVCMTA